MDGTTLAPARPARRAAAAPAPFDWQAIYANPLVVDIWHGKYRLKRPDGTSDEATPEDTLRRAGRALFAKDPDQAKQEATIYAMVSRQLIMGGRINAGAGTAHKVTLCNCFVMGTIPDDLSGIFQHLREAALTMQQGGGIGYDFSTLRPKGAPVRGVGADASGPLSFMDVWDSMCRTIMSAGTRRGAMMATLRCDHPDIEDFIDAKQAPGRLRMFNLSVLVTDALMQAVKDDAPWPLSFDGTVYRTIQARALWDKIMRATYDHAEPGVIFIDRVNALNNLAYCETISCSNPCGEQMLPPYGDCDLGQLNLAALVLDPFTPKAKFDWDRIDQVTKLGIRALDNVLDVTNWPLEEQRKEAEAKRRVGLGFTAWADALIMQGLRYGSPESLALADKLMRRIANAAYVASIELAVERGPFPLYDAAHYLDRPFIRQLQPSVRSLLKKYGIRNALLLSIAPTGTISIAFAGNSGSGLEPIFSFDKMIRNVLQADGTRKAYESMPLARALYEQRFGPCETKDLPPEFVSAMQLHPSEHVRMQAAFQRWIDSSISKTINYPTDLPFHEFEGIYQDAYALGCKGCTTYRPNPASGRGAVLEEAGKVISPVTQSESRGPAKRPEIVEGRTYKLVWPHSGAAYYVTINHLMGDDGTRRPIEIFINSKDVSSAEHFASLTRMVSAIFRKDAKPTFVFEELKQVWSPQPAFVPELQCLVPSLTAYIGMTIEAEFVRLGVISAPGAHPVALVEARVPAEAPLLAAAGVEICPKCQAPSFVRQEGCGTCSSCGFSDCG